MLQNGGELDGERILKPESVHLMTTNALPPEIRFVGNEVGPALGTEWGQAGRFDPTVQSRFLTGGKLCVAIKLGNCDFWVDPAEKLSAVVMTQAGSGKYLAYFNAVRHLIYGALSVPEQPALPPSATAAIPSAAMLADYAGKYTFGRSTSSRDKQSWADGGVGQIGIATVSIENDGLRASKIIADGAAAKAGVGSGDLITHIDDAPIKGLTLEQVFKKLLGPAGTKLQLKIMRAGRDTPMAISIVREPVLSRAVELEVRVEDGNLVVASIGQWPILEFEKGKRVSIVALSDDRRLGVDGGDHSRIDFVRASAGKVSGAVLNPGPWEQKGVRVMRLSE